MKVVGYDLSMIQGDSECLIVSLSDSVGNVPLILGDIIYFSVKDPLNHTVYALQKIVTLFQNGNALISLLPEDTKSLPCREYKYDVQLSRSDGSVKTIIPASRFTLERGITNE